MALSEICRTIHRRDRLKIGIIKARYIENTDPKVDIPMAERPTTVAKITSVYSTGTLSKKKRKLPHATPAKNAPL
jgi:hypothetical protein